MPFDFMTGWKRQMWRWILLSVMLIQLTTLFFNLSHWISDRKTDQLGLSLAEHYKDANDYHKRREDVSAARSRVAVMMINAIADGRSFTAEEKAEIGRLWKAAEYDKIQQTFLDQ